MLLTLVAVVAAATLWVLNCSGPQPEVGAVRLVEPAVPGGPYRVEALIQNRSWGEGEVALTLRLHDPANGRTIQTDRKVALRGNETTLLVTEIQAPPGTYRAEVEATYPPR